MKVWFLVSYKWNRHTTLTTLVLSENEAKIRDYYSQYREVNVCRAERWEIEMYSARGIQKIEI